MISLTTIQALVLLGSATMTTLLTLHAWQRRPAVGSRPFALLMLAISLWSLAYLLEITSPIFAEKMFWIKVRYSGMVIVPAAWLLFVWEYTGYTGWLTRQKIALVSLVSVITILLGLSNEVHGFIWHFTGINIADPIANLGIHYSPWFWIYTIFAYVCLLIGFVLLVSHWQQHPPPLYRWRAVVLFIGLLLPWTGDVLHIYGVISSDLTLFVLVIISLLLVHYALYFRLFDINPAAHHAVVNSMEEGVIVLDQKHLVVAANPAAQAMMRLETTPIGDAIATVWPNLAHYLDGAPEQYFELAPPQPQLPYYEVTVSPLYDWQRALQGKLLIIRDITRRKMQEQLRSDLTRTMVHDLRAPISNTLFALQVLKGDLHGIVSSDSNMLLDMTFANTEKTLSLVDQILDVHRLESGKLPVTFSSVSLPQLIECVLAMQKSRIAQKQLQVVCDLPQDLPQAWADSDLLERVLQNLIDNAIKFSPIGGTITLTANQVIDEWNDSAPKLWVTVQDEGPGVPEAMCQVIFEKYVTGEYGEIGSGLGLFFCQMALAAHGEQIWIDTLSEAGAIFVFSLATAQSIINSPPCQVIF